MLNILKQALFLWSEVESRRKVQFYFLFALTLVSSIAEVVSLGAVVPFIGVITDPQVIMETEYATAIIAVFNVSGEDDFVFILTVIFILAALLAGGLRICLIWVSAKVGNATGADLGANIYQRTLYQPYSDHVKRNSSEIISGITHKVDIATSVILSIVTVFTTFFLFIAILSTLILIDPEVAITAGLVFGLSYLLVALYSRKKLVSNGLVISKQQTEVIRSLQEGLGGIREVLLEGSQELYCDSYRKSIYELQRAGAQNLIINQSPRYLMETIGLVLVAVFILFLVMKEGEALSSLPALGALALGAQRLLPLMQQLYGNWSVITGNQAVIDDVIELLRQPLPEFIDRDLKSSFEFNEYIKLKNLSFSYSGAPPDVLDNISLEITKGSTIGFVGSTGSGKSTLLDVVMGLLEPQHGELMVDGQLLNKRNLRAWQRIIAHVPQEIFLLDASIAENVAFGMASHEINYDLVFDCIVKADLRDMVETREDGIYSNVGERGVSLSGGQKQRLALARALYKKARVLVLDEATSALDTDTEKKIMRAITDLDSDITTLIIAHRLSTLSQCDVIYVLSNGRIEKKCSYQELVSG